MATPSKPRRPWRTYAVAEDLCDPYEAVTDTRKPSSGRPAAEGYGLLTRSAQAIDDVEDGATSARPRHHAINLAEALSSEDREPPSRRCADTEGRAAPAVRGTSGRSSRMPAAVAPCAETPDTPFVIRSVHPAGEGETVAVELCVPTAFAEAAGAADGRPNGLYTQKSEKSARLHHGGATVAPRSPTRSKCDFSTDWGGSAPTEAVVAGRYGDTVPSAPDAPQGDTTSDEKPPRLTTQLKLYLLVEQYADLRPRAGAITEAEAETLVTAGKLCSAVRRGMRLLGYGDRSARRLAYQLTAKGIDREIAESAVAYLVEKGLIQEDNSVLLRAESSLRKLYGPRHIREDLRACGYTSAAIDEALEALSDTDFEANCATLVRRKYRLALSDGTLAADRTARQKLTASLVRLGYDTDTIRAALRSVLEEL